MPPKKAKGQKMALSDFFADQATGSWADETDDFPTAPAPKDPNALRRGDPGYFESRPDRGARDDASRGPPREELPLPSKPPYTAFVGNLSFETSEGDLSDFFSGLTTVSHKLISDFEGKPKGFGYVEFSSQEHLKSALDMSGGQILGRTVRISVAEPPSSRSGGFGGPSMAEEASQWRRTGPLPAPAASASSRPGRSFDSPREEQGERDWSAARGSKFVPAPPAAGGFRDGPRREASGPGFQRESFQRENAGAADEASAWRSTKPLAQPAAEPVRDAPPHQRAPQVTSPGLADTEQTWTRASKLRVSEPGHSRSTRENTGESEDRGEWRGSRNGSAFNSRQGSINGESGPNSAANSPQITRKALNLLPRNTSSASTPAASSEAGSASSATAPASKASPFGAAKPVDSAAREAEAAARLAKREEERKAAAAAKAKAAAEQKEKSQAQDREQPKRVHPSRAGSQQSEKPLSPPPVAAKKETPKEKEKKETPKEKKEANVRAAFSFAAAARAEGLVEGEGDDEEVKDVTKSVDEVAI